MFLPVAQRGVWSPQPGGTPQTNPRPPQALRPVPQLCDPQDLEAWAVRGTDRAMQTGLCRGNESRRGGQNDLSLFSGLGLLSRGSGEGRGVILKARWHVAPSRAWVRCTAARFLYPRPHPHALGCAPAPRPPQAEIHFYKHLSPNTSITESWCARCSQTQDSGP